VLVHAGKSWAVNVELGKTLYGADNITRHRLTMGHTGQRILWEDSKTKETRIQDRIWVTHSRAPVVATTKVASYLKQHNPRLILYQVLAPRFLPHSASIPASSPRLVLALTSTGASISPGLDPTTQSSSSTALPEQFSMTNLTPATTSLGPFTRGRSVLT